jgi:hypothetical protein
MEAIRCLSCGETRWSLFGRAKPGAACPSCGGATAVERRRPGTQPPRRPPPVERRDKREPAHV